MSEWLRTMGQMMQQQKIDSMLVHETKKEEIAQKSKRREFDVTPLVMTCHYKNPEMTTMCLRTLLAKNKWVKKVLIVDTSEEQDAPNALHMGDDRIQVIPAKGMVHSDGVEFGLKWARSKVYTGCKKGKDRWVLLIDSDVLFDHDVRDILQDSMDNGYVLTGHLQNSMKNHVGMTVRPRIHPAFCLINLSFLTKNNIPFMNWEKIQPEGREGWLGHTPQKFKWYEFRNETIYDVGGTMYEEVKNAGGTVNNLGQLWEYDKNRFDENTTTVFHIGSISWGDEPYLVQKWEWAKEKFHQICAPVTILTRFHKGRETRFKELLESLKGQEFEQVVSVEEESQREFVLSCNPKAKVVKVERGTGPGFFNGYINKLKEGINGPVWVLDSDDVAYPDAINTILKFYDEDRLNVFPVKWKQDRILPQRNPDLISSQCLVWNPAKIKVDWSDKVYEADNQFMNDCKKLDLVSFVTLNEGQFVAWLKENNNGK